MSCIFKKKLWEITHLPSFQLPLNKKKHYLILRMKRATSRRVGADMFEILGQYSQNWQNYQAFYFEKFLLLKCPGEDIFLTFQYRNLNCADK